MTTTPTHAPAVAPPPSVELEELERLLEEATGGIFPADCFAKDTIFAALPHLISSLRTAREREAGLVELLRECRSNLAADGTIVGIVKDHRRMRQFMDGIHALHRRIDAALSPTTMKEPADG